MKRIIIYSLVVAFAAVALITGHLIYLNNLSEAASYPADTFMQNQANKTALIIVAHDDDAVSMSGTISFLCENGWEVRELCFYQGWKGKDNIRKKDLAGVAKLLGMKSAEFYDIELRKGLDNIEKPWLPVSYSTFDSAYNQTTALQYIENFIVTYKPSVIFTLDDVIGGYGHPDHVFVSKLVSDYCRIQQNDSAFSVERIYQAVFDPQMNEKILKDMEAFNLAKKVYNVSSSPKPDVHFSLEGREEIKKKALQMYTTEQNSLTKIWPCYNYYPAGIYFRIFDKEYYRVLNKNKGYH